MKALSKPDIRIPTRDAAALVERRCPICQSEARLCFETRHARVARCQAHGCGHFFAVGASRDQGVMNEVQRQSPAADRADQAGLLAFLKRRNAIPADGRALDVGAGDASWSLVLQRAGCRVACVEPSAARRARIEAEGVQCYADCGEVPRGFSADLVTMLEVVEHVPDVTATLRELHGIMKPGACIFVTTPSATGLRARFSREKSNSFAIPEHVHFFTPASLRFALRGAGFARLREVYVASLVPFRSPVRRLVAMVATRLRLGGGLHVLGWK